MYVELALSKKTLERETERIKIQYGYMLDELEQAAVTVERITELVRAHLKDFEKREQGNIAVQRRCAEARTARRK